MKVIKDFVIIVLCAFAIFALFFGACLQESYRLNPPTQAERAEHPFIVGFLAGDGDETD